VGETARPASVTMVREDIEDIPAFTLPKPYRFRTYKPGDEETWYRIWTLADQEYRAVNPNTFAENFGHDIKALAARQFYVCDAKGDAIGTASAWFREDYKGKPWGLVHWVAIVPEAQGKGLAKPLMTHIMARLKKLGHPRAMLVTQPYRVRAIKIYLDFGFTPDLMSEIAFVAWRQVRDALGQSVLDEMDLGDR